ncbi:hypothetical protein QX201_13689 [Fusarium graminearum]
MVGNLDLLLSEDLRSEKIAEIVWVVSVGSPAQPSPACLVSSSPSITQQSKKSGSTLWVSICSRSGTQFRNRPQEFTIRDDVFFFDKTLQLQYLIVNVSIRESEVGTTHALLPSRNFHVTSSSTGGDEPPRTAPQPETQGSSVNSDQILIQPCPATNRSSGSRKMFGVLLH